MHKTFHRIEQTSPDKERICRMWNRQETHVDGDEQIENFVLRRTSVNAIPECVTDPILSNFITMFWNVMKMLQICGNPSFVSFFFSCNSSENYPLNIALQLTHKQIRSWHLFLISYLVQGFILLSFIFLYAIWVVWFGLISYDKKC